MSRLMTAVAASVGVAILATTSATNAGRLLDKVLKSKTLTVAVGTDWGPVSHLNEKHELEGYDVDIAKHIAKSLGVEVKFFTPGWDIITAGKWEGRWDIAMGQMTPTAARAEKFDFPAIYFYEQVFAVVQNGSKATKLADLDGKTVGVTANTTYEAYANHALTADWKGSSPVTYQFEPGAVKTYASTNVAFDDLRLGDGVRLNAVITDGTSANNAIGAGYPIKLLGDPLYAAPGAIAVLHGDKEFSGKIAAAIQKMKENGTLSKLSLKWYGVDYTTEK
ncbi:transporter substrate-binding domain-containing protein [Mesorhizobium neociceri]|uniref:Transporter substrate-binding domain-containing protein n=1 Tax=Mesorhizobium neociceri TaxID=1307853 RepID=A0A838BIB2_9HYPH|nr:transporter substrate-binding domain-containing protein [Mesorhizobium neociceri]MBA1145214.1 transporter substrate-binding domain-containing protein [Mesorhizobium neociceri]